MLRRCALAALLACALAEDRCTTIMVDKFATKLGATIVTHNNDCAECDFRLARVEPGYSEHAGLEYVRKCKGSYPLEVSNRSSTWDVGHLEYTTLNTDFTAPPFVDAECTAAQHAWASAAWQTKTVSGSVDVADLEKLAGRGSMRYGSLESSYGILNDAGLSIGESTCESQLVGLAGRPCATCVGPLFDMASLTKLAMHYCDTARCAIRLIGGAAEEHGFYGEGAVPIAFEAGEALSIADGDEVWLLHLSPDDTGLSAVWFAAKLPEGHVSVVANAFRLRGVPPVAFTESKHRSNCLNEVDDCDWLASTNLVEVVTRAGHLQLTSTGEMDFAKSLGTRSTSMYFPYSTRRIWRVHSTVAPARTASDVADVSKSDYLGSEFAWSIKAERLLDVGDILALNRDYYQGTPYDLTTGPASGPWGDPTRYEATFRGRADLAPELQDDPGMLSSGTNGAMFERAISIFRTAYSTAAVSRGASATPVLWFAPGTPHASTFVPVYVAKDVRLPPSLSVGHMLQLNAEALWWQTALISNWMRSVFKFAKLDVNAAQRSLEVDAFTDGSLWAVSEFSDVKPRREVLSRKTASEFNSQAGQRALNAWQALFQKLVVKYRDGFKISGNVEVVQTHYFYPITTLEYMGYFTVDPRGFDKLRAPAPTPSPTLALPAAPTLPAPSPTPMAVPAVPSAAKAAANDAAAAAKAMKVTHPRGPGTIVLAACLVFIGVAAFALGRWTAPRKAAFDPV